MARKLEGRGPRGTREAGPGLSGQGAGAAVPLKGLPSWFVVKVQAAVGHENTLTKSKFASVSKLVKVTVRLAGTTQARARARAQARRRNLNVISRVNLKFRVRVPGQIRRRA